MGDTRVPASHAGGMGKDFGPWVTHDWCPSCHRNTEQTRWHRRFLGEHQGRNEHTTRCNECAADVAGVPAG